ncbi:MAG TPA: hypothetical protein PKY81_13220 [bacterium]|nr:hypothetical protein [bacterium]HPN31908.1 hypothetical protein [bacterium]
MKTSQYLFYLLIISIISGCAKNQDESIEKMMTGSDTVSVTNNKTYMIDSDGSINLEDEIDTASIRKKAREEFEAQNQIMFQKYDERKAKEESGITSDTLEIIKNKDIDEVIKNKKLINQLDKKKTNE